MLGERAGPAWGQTKACEPHPRDAAGRGEAGRVYPTLCWRASAGGLRVFPGGSDAEAGPICKPQRAALPVISPLPGPTVPTPHPALGGPQDSIQQGGRLDGQRPPTAAVSPPPPIMTLLWDPRAEEGDGFLLTCHPPLVRRPGPGPRTPRVLTHSPPDSGDTSYPQPPSGKETPVFLVGTSGLEAASLPRISQVGAEGPHGARLALQPLPLPDSATKRTSHTWQGAGTLSSLGSLGLAGGRGQWD